MVERLAKLLRGINLVVDSTAGFLFDGGAPVLQRLLQGCDAGTQCDSFSSKVFSCANAGVTLAASSSAKNVAENVFLIDIVSLVASGFNGPLRILLYDIIIIASTCSYVRTVSVQPYNSQGGKYCGQK